MHREEKKSFRPASRLYYSCDRRSFLSLTHFALKAELHHVTRRHDTEDHPRGSLPVQEWTGTRYVLALWTLWNITPFTDHMNLIYGNDQSQQRTTTRTLSPETGRSFALLRSNSVDKMWCSLHLCHWTDFQN